jgi:NAD(P)-dependent dehydrogenase (short-subunit alcohol dehydrogenase family)
VKGRAGFSVYSASKAAIRNLARSWLLELKERHIRVNVISPGSTATQGLGALSGSPENVEAFFNILKERVPLGRMGQPSEIAAVVAFMASEGASFMNGADIQIDGGEAQI